MWAFWQSWNFQRRAESSQERYGTHADYIDKLNELDTAGVEPMSHIFPVYNVFREDVVTNGDDRDNMLKMHRQKKTEHIKYRER